MATGARRIGPSPAKSTAGHPIGSRGWSSPHRILALAVVEIPMLCRTGCTPRDAGAAVQPDQRFHQTVGSRRAPVLAWAGPNHVVFENGR